MSRRAVLCLALLLPVSIPASAGAQVPGGDGSRDFVRVVDGGFRIGDRPYHFIGVNFWFGMNLGAEHPSGDRARLVRELDRMAELGIRNLRVMAATEGPAGEPWRVHPAVQNAPGEYDERVLRGLDFLLAEMAKRDMRAVLVLNNFFQWSGGMPQYVSWATGDPIPYPSQSESWDTFQRFSARFYGLPEARALFERYVGMLIDRENTITGVAYRDDPTIMSWQLSNEPRGFQETEAYVDWVDEASWFVQERAPNQLVSLGGEGKLTPYEETQFSRVAASPGLDYVTVHLWIENWGWYRPRESPAASFPVAVGRSMAYLAEHVAVAERLGKPLVLEEFGVSRDGLDYDPSAPVTYRNEFYRIMFEALHKAALEGTVVAGGNVWSWTGEARPVEPGGTWSPGDPFTGDPPHELQGWYSIYDDDTSTLALIREYAARMRQIDAASAASGDGR
jgi:mannan endo-1,4-beta-mannosidase